MEPNAIVAIIVLEEERLIVAAVGLDRHTGSVIAHGGVIDVRDGVPAMLEAEPRPPHHERDHTLSMAHCEEE